MVADPKALHYILHTSYNFPKRTDALKVAEMVTGEAALVCAQGAEHFSPRTASSFAMDLTHFPCSTRYGP
jgi:hypothetical protein